MPTFECAPRIAVLEELDAVISSSSCSNKNAMNVLIALPPFALLPEEIACGVCVHSESKRFPRVHINCAATGNIVPDANLLEVGASAVSYLSPDMAGERCELQTILANLPGNP